jgi:hypothetical protein
LPLAEGKLPLAHADRRLKYTKRPEDDAEHNSIQ